MIEWRMVERHPYLGLEFDWLCLDQDGHIGYFSTAGVGPIPNAVLDQGAAFQDLFEWTMSLPKIGSSEVVLHVSHFTGDWDRVAERGLFAFDWRREDKAYKLIAKPTVPIRVGDLPLSLPALRVARETAVDHCFADETCITF